jgi:hypothetical protein
MGNLKSFSIFAFAFCFLVSGAHATTTDWLTGIEIQKLARKGEFRGKKVDAIKCKDGGKIGLNVRTGFFKVTYSDNPTKKKFHWSIGNTYGKSVVMAKKKNMVLVSHDQYVRKSGLVIRCGVWHEKP